jgi:hypothetical protein
MLEIVAPRPRAQSSRSTRLFNSATQLHRDASATTPVRRSSARLTSRSRVLIRTSSSTIQQSSTNVFVNCIRGLSVVTFLLHQDIATALARLGPDDRRPPAWQPQAQGLPHSIGHVNAEFLHKSCRPELAREPETGSGECENRTAATVLETHRLAASALCPRARRFSSCFSPAGRAPSSGAYACLARQRCM